LFIKLFNLHALFLLLRVCRLSSEKVPDVVAWPKHLLAHCSCSCCKSWPRKDVFLNSAWCPLCLQLRKSTKKPKEHLSFYYSNFGQTGLSSSSCLFDPHVSLTAKQLISCSTDGLLCSYSLSPKVFSKAWGSWEELFPSLTEGKLNQRSLDLQPLNYLGTWLTSTPFGAGCYHGLREK